MSMSIKNSRMFAAEQPRMNSSLRARVQHSVRYPRTDAVLVQHGWAVVIVITFADEQKQLRWARSSKVSGAA